MQHQEAEPHCFGVENWHWESEKTAAASAKGPAERPAGKMEEAEGAARGAASSVMRVGAGVRWD